VRAKCRDSALEPGSEGPRLAVVADAIVVVSALIGGHANLHPRSAGWLTVANAQQAKALVESVRSLATGGPCTIVA
jgi:hypothetical protein